MRLTPAYLTSVASFYDMFELEPKHTNDVFVCTNITCSILGADEFYDAMAAAAEGQDIDVRSFECLGACDIAPMASVNGEYVGPLELADAERIVEDLAAGRPVLTRQAVALPPLGGPQRDVGSRHPAARRHRVLRARPPAPRRHRRPHRGRHRRRPPGTERAAGDPPHDQSET